MKISKDIIKKVNNGDALTDAELSDAIKFYSSMEDGLYLLGKEYILARTPITHTRYRLEGYRDARRSERRNPARN